MNNADVILDVRDLCVDYISERGVVRAVNHVSFSIRAGEVFGLAGESGSGKSTAALAILRLLPAPAVIRGGQVLFRGRDILKVNDAQLGQLRWRDVSMVFQSAMNALNPVMRIGRQISDAIVRHERIPPREARERTQELLRIVGIDPARASAYPHELSGGMRQRVVIAVALALRPSLIIMDEPTTALDVVVQREILDEITDLQQRFGFSILFITHDMSLLVEISNRIAIMYAGEIVEEATARELYHRPAHPYTRGLMNSFPSLDGENVRLTGIAGSPPNLLHPPSGCRFRDRCPHAMPVCATVSPAVTLVGDAHTTRCHLYDQPLPLDASEKEMAV
ncbi:MAG TPA: ABC transporter ATP-binding protein [Thermomicrobiales bacterium]|nr:ABC transporter ATP-binding protein [Thermomicrobiales bacterium]